MFRKMRRNKQQLSNEESVEVLKKGMSGVLAVVGDDGYPYAVPLSYVYSDSKIIFHCANVGHKIDAINNNNKVSFCVTDQDRVVSERFTTHFRSVIVFGKARIIESDFEKRAAIEALAKKYSSEMDPTNEIENSWNHFCMVEIDIEHMTGKAAKELVNGK